MSRYRKTMLEALQEVYKVKQQAIIILKQEDILLIEF